MEIIVGEIFSTKWYNNWRTHIKSDFTFNIKHVDEAKSGNDLNIFLKQNYKLGKIKFALVNQYYYHFKNENNKSEILDNTQKKPFYTLIRWLSGFLVAVISGDF
jgi:hypothetical protein